MANKGKSKEVKRRIKLNKKEQELVKRKIRFLVNEEGKPADQAAAIALTEIRKFREKKPGKFSRGKKVEDDTKRKS